MDCPPFLGEDTHGIPLTPSHAKNMFVPPPPPNPARVEKGCGCNADGGFPVGGTIGETRNDEGGA